MTDPELMTVGLAAFQEKASAKFKAGMEEHNPDGTRPLTSRDCLEELEKEIIDAWFYIQGEKAKEQFHPAATAPQDGTMILGYLRHYRQLVPMAYDAARQTWICQSPIQAGTTIFPRFYITQNADVLIGWKPIPPAPKQPEAKPDPVGDFLKVAQAIKSSRPPRGLKL